MEDLENRRPKGDDFTTGDASEIDSQNQEISEYNLSYDGEEASESEEEKSHRLPKELTKKIRAKVEMCEIRCLKRDVLKILKRYREGRKEQGKKLSARRIADIKKIHVMARNYKDYPEKEDFLFALQIAVDQIKGGKLIFNRNKSKLKDALNELIRSYSNPSSLEKETLYQGICHYTKIHLSLERRAQGGAPKSGLESLENASEKISFLPLSDELDGNGKDSLLAENLRLKKRLAEMEEDNLARQNRHQASRSAGDSGLNSKHSRGKTPPVNNGGEVDDSPSHSYEEVASPQKHGSLKKVPGGGTVFSLSVNDDSLEDLSPSVKPKKGGEASRFSVADEAGKTVKRAGKK